MDPGMQIYIFNVKNLSRTVLYKWRKSSDFFGSGAILLAGTVIDHRYLMGVRANLLRTLNFYKSVLLDDVHFYLMYYRNLAANLYRKVIKGKRS
jgi:hypothetical protein